jgi:predicted amidohydrolase YtcJ
MRRGDVGTYFTGGTIWCGIGTYATSLRIDNGVVVELNSAPHDGDEIIDLGSHFLAPAFLDGHAHPLFAGRESQGPLLNGLTTVDQMLAEVKRFADSHPDSPWIVGGAYEAVAVPGGDFLATWIDDVVADRPVVLHAVDHHTVWVNSKALEIAGITRETEDPEGGTIARNSDGSPRGTLREPLAIQLIIQHAPARTLKEDVAAIKWASDRYLESGVTASTDAWIEPGMAEAYIEAEKSGALGIDLNLFFLAQPDSWRDRIEYFAGLRSEVEALGESSHLRAKTVKIIGDGALSSGTAALLDPYLDNPTSRGLLIWSDEEILAAATKFDALGYQLHIHAIGDAAVRQALNTIEAVIAVNPQWDRRPVIAHAQLIHPDDLPRFAELGVIANYQPLWTYLDPMNKELIAPRIGDARNNSQYQLASMAATGARITYGSDWPVTSYLPLAALGVPTHRQAPGGSAPWSPKQSISVEQSLSFYTEGVAFQTFNEKRFGRIEVGMTADLVRLSANPLTVDPLEISAIEVVATYKNGNRY